MKIALTEEFLDEMIELPAAVGKGFRDIIKEQLRSNETAFRRGLNLEQLKNSPFHSLRINKQFRILLRIEGDARVFCRVGDHDFVYSRHLDRNYEDAARCNVVRNVVTAEGAAGPSGLVLDDIVGRLNEQHQRATYGAVAGFLGGAVTPRSLMTGRPRDRFNSWVVAGAGPGYGRPTRYNEDDIHPECRRQIRERRSDFIADPEILGGWLRAKRWRG
jgi:hypothetical protein